MLHPSCLIVKKGERRRENGGSGFFGLKKRCEMVVLSFILHAPSFMLDSNPKLGLSAEREIKRLGDISPDYAV